MSNVTVQEALNEAFEALLPFADCLQYIEIDEDDEEWAKFRLLIKNYRQAATAYDKCKAALADIEKCEPVGTAMQSYNVEEFTIATMDKKRVPIGTKLYTLQQHREWIGASDYAINKLIDEYSDDLQTLLYQYGMLLKQINTKG